MLTNYNSLLWNALLNTGNVDPASLECFLENESSGLNLENEKSWDRIIVVDRKSRSNSTKRYNGLNPSLFAETVAQAINSSDYQIYVYCRDEKKPRQLCRLGESFTFSQPQELPA